MKAATLRRSACWAWFRFEAWNSRGIFLVNPLLGCFLGWMVLRKHPIGSGLSGGAATFAIVTVVFLNMIFHEEFSSSRSGMTAISGTLEFTFALAISRKDIYWAKMSVAFLVLASLGLPFVVGGLVLHQEKQSILFGSIWLGLVSMSIPFFLFASRFGWWRNYLLPFMLMGLFIGSLSAGFAWVAEAHSVAFYVTILPFVFGMLWLGERLFVRLEVA